MKKINLPDWAIRSLKTFVQAFFGVLIPEVVAILNNGWPEDWHTVWAYLAPIIAASLSAGISAAWNIIKERLNKTDE